MFSFFFVVGLIYVLGWLISLFYIGWLKHEEKLNKTCKDIREGCECIFALSFLGFGFVFIFIWGIEWYDKHYDYVWSKLDKFTDFFARIYDEKPKKVVDDLTIEELELLVKQKKGEG